MNIKAKAFAIILAPIIIYVYWITRLPETKLREELTEIATLSVGLLIIEGRQRHGIDGSIMSVIQNTPITWPLYVIYAPNMDQWIRTLSFNDLTRRQGRKVILREMPEKYRGRDQNVVASDKEFWKSFTEDWLLLFQADSSMCSHPTIKLRDFFNFDFVGAPWKQFPDGYGAPYLGGRVYVGNGGFSLRNRTWMLSCLDKMHFVPPEDTFFAYCTERLGGRAAKTQQAWFFSIEGIPTPEGALGIHGVCTYPRLYTFGCDKNWGKKWLSTCPESEFMFPNGRCWNC